MVNQKESYLKERKYSAYSQEKQVEKLSGKFQYWKGILGKDKITQLAKENDKVRLHLEGVPYMASEHGGRQRDALNVEAKQENIDIINFLENENPVFAPFYVNELNKGRAKLWSEKERSIIYYSEKVEKDFFRYTLNCLQKISVRTLILEMHRLKAEGKLLGDNEAEEYQDFLRGYLSDISYICMLHERYPVLFRMMREQTEQCAEYFCEIMRHLEADRQRIEELFLEGASICELSGIHCMYGDTHHHGKSVAGICLNGTVEVIYKPRSLENELLFQGVLRKISKSVSLWDDRMGLKIISHSDYGWEEKIYFRECGTEEGVKRFYQRTGIQIFLAYLFGTSDLHCENMIARGEYPVLIDLETLIHLQSQKAGQNEIFNSVLKSGILPTYLPGSNKIGNEVGALSGEGGRKSKMRIPVIRNAYSSKMRMEYCQGIMNHTQNRVKYKGRPVEAAQYIKDLLSGFQKAYQYVKDNPVLQKDILDQVEARTSRQVVSDTMKYAALLNSSFYPDLLADGGDREVFARTVGMIGKPRDQRLVECEVESILCGDIPYFYNKGKHLMCEKYICIPNYFMYTPRQAVQERLLRLGPEDERFQIRLIELSLTIAGKMGKDMIDSEREKMDSQKREINKQISQEKIFSICEKISELIIENVYEDEERNLQVLSIDLSEQCRSKIRKVTHYFYEGISGIIVFLYSLEKVRFQKKSIHDKEQLHSGKNVADRLFMQLKEYTENLTVSENKSQDTLENMGRTGMFDGEFSIVFAYLLLYEIKKEKAYLRLAEIHAKKSLLLIQKDQSFDLLGGNAGGIIVLLKLYDITGNEEYLQAAQLAGEILCGHAEKMEHGIGWRGAEKMPLCGMAHGNSGILLSLSRLYQKTGQKSFHDICLQGLDYEDSMYEEAIHDWKDLRKESGEQEHIGEQEMAWCHGAGGIALARKLMIEALDSDVNEDAASLRCRLKKDIKRAIPTLEKYFWRKEMCVCHGTLGNYQILKKLQEYFDGDVIDRARSELYGQIMRWEKEKPEFILQEYYAPGFMNGVAGIGYYLLKELDEELPEILELQ